MALHFITPAALTLPVFGIYGDVDVSAHVPVGATGVALRILNGSAASSRSYGLRKNGSTDDLYGAISRAAHMWETVGLDSARKFEIKRESADITAELVGWFDSGSVFFDAAVEIQLANTYSQESANLSSDVPSGALAVSLLFGFVASSFVYARPGGATHLHAAIKAGRLPMLCGVASQTVEIYRNRSADKAYLLGYHLDGVTVAADPPDDTPASVNTWTDVDLGTGATGGWWWHTNRIADVAWGVREDGAALDWQARSSGGGLALSAASAETAETFVGSFSGGPEIWRLGIFTEPADDHTVQPVSLVSTPTFSAPTLTSEDAHTVSPVSLISAPDFSAPTISVAVDQRPEQIILIARPFDPDATTDYTGPPVPFGTGTFDATAFSADGAETAVYLGDGRGGSYVSLGTDTPANQPFEPRLTSAFQFTARAFEGARPSGQASEGTGAIEIAAGDGGFDDEMVYAWDGRSVELYRLRVPGTLSAKRLILRGTVETVRWSARGVTLGLRDRMALFSRPLITATYGGTGGLDGDASVIGAPKPQGYGPVINAEGVLINSAKLIWQVHDRVIQGVDSVRDKGVALDFDADYGTYALLAAASLSAGEYATCLASGLIRLGGAPDGRVTVDFQGDALGGYVDTAAGIVKRIATTRLGGALSTADLDAASFTALDTAQPAAIQFHTAGENPTVAAVLADIMATVGGWLAFTREGRLTVQRLTAPSSPTFTISPANESAVESLTALRTPPSWRERVEWGRPWVIQTGDDLAGSVSAEDRDRWARRHYAEARDSSIRGAHRLAPTAETASLFAFEADALTEAERLLALWGTPRDVIEVTQLGAAFDRWLGDVGTVTVEDADGTDRYDTPKDCVVVGIYENARTGRTQLTMIG